MNDPFRPDETQRVTPLAAQKGASAPAPPPEEMRSGVDVARLGLRVEELERRLKARTLELETEVRGKERLRKRVQELVARAAELEETSAVLHREAVSATALSRELDETLRVAAEARRQLGDALAAERSRREALEGELAAAKEKAAMAAAETATLRDSLGNSVALAESAARAATAADLKRLEAELRDARVQLAAMRQKSEGREAHIDSLRAELDFAREALQQASGEREKLRAAAADAEKIRREGEEALEKAREAARRQEGDEEKRRREIDGFKDELRARVEREIGDMRRDLEAERSRLYADLEAEGAAAAASAEKPEERLARLRAEMEKSRKEITREVENYMAPEPLAARPASPEVRPTPPQEIPSAPQAPEKLPWQWKDESHILLWIAIGVGFFALILISVLTL